MTSVATTTTTTETTNTSVNNNGRLDMTQLPSLVGGSNDSKGMTIQEELMNRRKTCRFIEEAGKIIKLPRVAIATAIVFFHRFYSKHSFYNHNRFEVAIACIVLAAKTEESPKKLNVVLQECYKLKLYAMKSATRNNTTTTTTTTSSTTTGSTADATAVAPNSNANANISLSNNAITLLSSDLNDVKSEEFNKLKERVLLLERVTLHTIGFELSIDHPHKFLFDIIRTITIIKPIIEFETTNTNTSMDDDNNSNLSSSEIIKKLNNKLIQISINFANDSLHTTVCLQYNAIDIAIACIYLGCNFAKIQPISTKTWCDVLFESSSNTNSTGTPSNNNNNSTSTNTNTKNYINEIDTLASISLQILELISEKKGTDKSIVTKIRLYLNVLQGNNNSTTDTSDTVSEVANDPLKKEETIVDTIHSKQQSAISSSSSATKRSQSELKTVSTISSAAPPTSSSSLSSTTTDTTTSIIEKSGSPETKKQRT